MSILVLPAVPVFKKRKSIEQVDYGFMLPNLTVMYETYI